MLQNLLDIEIATNILKSENLLKEQKVRDPIDFLYELLHTKISVLDKKDVDTTDMVI